VIRIQTTRRRDLLSELFIHSWCGVCLFSKAHHSVIQQGGCQWSKTCSRYLLHPLNTALSPSGVLLSCESTSPVRLTTRQVWVAFGYQFPTRIHCRLMDFSASVPRQGHSAVALLLVVLPSCQPPAHPLWCGVYNAPPSPKCGTKPPSATNEGGSDRTPFACFVRAV